MRNVKIDIIANIQSQLNKKIKEWCAVDSKFIEKRSIPKGDSKIFINKDNNSFIIDKQQVVFELFNSYTDNDLLTKKSLIVQTIVDHLMDKMMLNYISYANSLGTLYSQPLNNKEIKFIFYGLIYNNENTVQLEYGFDSVFHSEGVE